MGFPPLLYIDKNAGDLTLHVKKIAGRMISNEALVKYFDYIVIDFALPVNVLNPHILTDILCNRHIASPLPRREQHVAFIIGGSGKTLNDSENTEGIKEKDHAET